MSACPLARRERDDDPDTSGNPRVAETVDQFEWTLVRILQAPNLETADALLRTFAEAAEARAVGKWEQDYTRRLELSAKLSALMTFHGDIDEAARVATDLVALPCHRRMSQLWELVAFARYGLDRRRPEAVWPALLRALKTVELEIPTNEEWLANQESLRSVLSTIWDAMSQEQRQRHEPYTPRASPTPTP